MSLAQSKIQRGTDHQPACPHLQCAVHAAPTAHSRRHFQSSQRLCSNRSAFLACNYSRYSTLLIGTCSGRLASAKW